MPVSRTDKLSSKYDSARRFEDLVSDLSTKFATKQDGMGMGLAIAQSIVQAHQGSLWAENNPDHGATFHFTIPVRK